jgi:CBS domain-containing protein
MAPGLRILSQVPTFPKFQPELTIQECIMKIRDLMTKTVASCHKETNLAAAGALMWETDCGVLPVVDERRRVTGVLTDRDVCIALTTNDRRPSAMTVGDVSPPRAFVCGQDEDIQAALKIMQKHKIHRLPVVNKTGTLEGIVSMNDIVLRAEKETGRRHPEVSYEDVILALQAICAHTPVSKQAAAATSDGRAAGAA